MSSPTTQTPLLSLRDLEVAFPSEAGRVLAVRCVDFDLLPGRTLGIVGESGSGKSVTSMAIMGLLPEYAKVTGSVKLLAQSLSARTVGERRRSGGKGRSWTSRDPRPPWPPLFPMVNQ